MRRFAAGILTLVLSAVAAPAARAVVEPVGPTVDGLRSEKGDRRISFVTVLRDRPDLAGLGLGTAGSWFPQFDAPGPVEGSTGDNARDLLPEWVAAFNHTTGPADPGCTEAGALARGCTPTYYFRTFSQDGPARSVGGRAGWAALRLPSGVCGRSGAIVDPHTAGNVNNTINRIQLEAGVPSSLFVSVVTDNTGGEHDPNRLELRGQVGLLDLPGEVSDSQIEATPAPAGLVANGVPDVYVFRVDGFEGGDYLKLRLRGSDAGASFGGLLFDERIDDVRPGAGRARSCR